AEIKDLGRLGDTSMTEKRSEIDGRTRDLTHDEAGGETGSVSGPPPARPPESARVAAGRIIGAPIAQRPSLQALPGRVIPRLTQGTEGLLGVRHLENAQDAAVAPARAAVGVV